MKNLGLFLITILFFSCSSPDKESKGKTTTQKTIKAEVSETDKQASKKENASTVKETHLRDITDEFCEKWDISSSFDSSYYGAFGKNYQRIDLIIDKIQKSTTPNKYLISGSTILKGKQVGYLGKLIISKVEQKDTDLYGMESGSRETVIFAEYELIEDKNIQGSGIFKGDFSLTIHENEDGSLDYDTFDWMQDGYTNYIFNGTWESPKNNTYQAYFADGKLDIGDLNVGAGEFVPNEKYVKYGWQSYMDLYFPNREE